MTLGGSHVGTPRSAGAAGATAFGLGSVRSGLWGLDWVGSGSDDCSSLSDAPSWDTHEFREESFAEVAAAPKESTDFMQDYVQKKMENAQLKDELMQARHEMHKLRKKNASMTQKMVHLETVVAHRIGSMGAATGC
jgi:hypothetical protein